MTIWMKTISITKLEVKNRSLRTGHGSIRKRLDYPMT